MTKKAKILVYLDLVAPTLPTPIYWEDINSIILGANKYVIPAAGVPSLNEYIGKTLYELYPKDMADHIKQHNEEVMRTGNVLSQEETILDITTGQIKYFIAVKAPLRDDEGNIIGIVGTSIDITAQKETEILAKHAKILEYLNIVASALPTPIAWLDVNSVVLGVNEQGLKAVGITREAYVGKSLFEIYPYKMAAHIKQHDEEVIRTGKVLSQEESIINVQTGKIQYFTAIKAPLYDDDNKIIGLVVTGIDITGEKEAERLKLENEINQNLLHEQDKFMKIANQVAHDIRSPLTSLLMIVRSCKEIPEADRIALREASISIGDIANHLLSKYQKKEADAETEERQAILVSATLLQLLTDKKYQYQEFAVKFTHDFVQKGYFAFIKIESSSFKRMLSNLINNSVDAFENKKGKVTLKLDADNEWVKVIIQDNGKGMPADLVSKIMNNIAVTAGKEKGHGIGLTQVRETLQRNQGELLIDSTLGKGTQITLTFPRVKAPHWIAEEIKLGKEDIIVILDDDASIHGAWNSHFEPILAEAPNLQLHHFILGNDALNFINNLSPDEKPRVFLLTDYELLKQELTGLHVVAKSQIERSILVTSHYTDPSVREEASKTGTKILPKQLASEIPINLDDTMIYDTTKNQQKHVDLILVDDDESFVETLMMFAFSDRTVDPYYDPQHFLVSVTKYPKDTKICLDNNYHNSDLKGVEIAKILHDLGYSNLYMLSGEVFDNNQVPDYLSIIKKGDLEGIKNLC